MANRIKRSKAILCALALSFAVMTACSQAAKETSSPAEFYKGKTVNFIVSSGPGSGTDIIARAIAPHIGKEIGATMKVEAMGSSEGRNYVYTQGKPDGLTWVIHSSSSLVSDDILKTPGVQFETEKFLFLADVNPSRRIMQISPKLTYKNLDEMRKAKGVKGGGTTAAGALATGAAVAFEILGLDGKVIFGYNGKKELMLAITRNEVDFMVTNDDGALQDEKDGNIRNFLVFGDKRSEVAPAVPTIVEAGVKVPKEMETVMAFATTGGTAVALPPGVAQDKVEYLRKAFQNLNGNKDLQKDMETVNGAWRAFVPGKQLQDDLTRMKENKSLAGQLNDIVAKYAATK
ncbi:MAG: hypothetical protein HYY30_05335 [Chloroflexi bacterium]|nr:hypothetical protein [Chloroflexota bacterium]